MLHYHGDEPKQVGQSVSQHTDHPRSFNNRTLVFHNVQLVWALLRIVPIASLIFWLWEVKPRLH